MQKPSITSLKPIRNCDYISGGVLISERFANRAYDPRIDKNYWVFRSTPSDAEWYLLRCLISGNQTKSYLLPASLFTAAKSFKIYEGSSKYKEFLL